MKQNQEIQNKEEMLCHIKIALIEMQCRKDAINEIMEELISKSFNVLATFYFRMKGETLEEISLKLGVSIVMVHKYIFNSLESVQTILKNYC